MFKFMVEPSLGPAADNNDDNISVTSTLADQHDPDEVFEVENILAEQPSEDGEMFYLVEWAGFRLHESTWEPESELGDELKALWEETKAKHASGELKPFDVQKFWEAREKAEEDHNERHRRRNAKRKKLGLPLTPPFPETDSSEDEALEVPVPAETSQPQPRTTPRQNQEKLFKGVPGPRPASVARPTTVPEAEGSRPRNETRRPSGEGNELRSAALPASNRPSAAVSTGYRGTARKPSNMSQDVASKSKPRPPNLTSSAVLGSSSAKPIAGTRKALTARRSKTQPAGNIFTGGKMRKQRAGLSKVMSDPTKTPKFFRKHHVRRLAEKRSRDSEDVAPDISKIGLFDITMGPVAGRRSSGGSGALIQSPTQQTPVQEAFESTEADPAATVPSVPPNLTSALRNPDAAPEAPLKKKRKSVRFLEDDEDQNALVQEPEPMDLDSPVNEGASSSLLQSHSSAPGPDPTAAPSRPSIDPNRCKPPVQGSQSSSKKMVLGRSSVEVIFNNLPRERHAWLADFLAKETLEFQHACLASAVPAQLDALVREPLAAGNILSKASEATLDHIAGYLTASLLGLYCGETEYNILVYPTKCDEWKSVPLGLETSGTAEVALRYYIFAPRQDCRLMLPPFTLSLFQPAVEDTKKKVEITDSPPERAVMVERLFGFDYNKLLPAKPKDLSTHIFFLAIPETRGAITRALYHWLRARNPECLIFTSHHPGSWAAFRARVESAPGVIIIHEMLIWSLRRIPKLSRYLLFGRDEYWCLSESVQSLPLYPSISVPEYVPPGEIRLTRLFPYRNAILLTPSFLVSEPRRALEFFNWFVSRWVGTFHYRLITAYNIHDYLLELADEKHKARQDLLGYAGAGQSESAANLSGISSEDSKCRYAAAKLAADLHVLRTAMAGPHAHDEDNSPLVFADESIDPNDEQSLVNWFGWWTTLRADQFRKFHVIGSSQSVKLLGSKRGERLVRIPKYSKVTLNDPDAVMEVIQERLEQVEESDDDDDSGNTDSGNPGSDGGQKQRPWSFQSNFISSEDLSKMAGYLESLSRLPGYRFMWMLYMLPVSWLDIQMADHFRDFTQTYHRIHDWFSFVYPFGTPKTGFNTYIGFFYTITEEWDPDNHPPQSRSPERHPWLAIYRPVNPHKKPWNRCEIIIWDPAAKTRLSHKRTPSEKDLIFMQRQLIQYVREHGEQKNPGMWLHQVWLGGFEWPSDCDSPYPFDVTLFYLEKMLGNLREYLPAPEHAMENRGFRKVALDPSDANPVITRSPAAASSADSALFVNQDAESGDAPMDIDDGSEDSAEEDDGQTRIIFHPPRGNRQPGGTAASAPFRSKCRNTLYEEARLVRARREPGQPAPTHMTYRYRPTMDWYSQQCAEGRGFSHVNVDSWEGVFKVLKIGEAAAAEKKTAPAGAAGAAAADAHSTKRRESTESR